MALDKQDNGSEIMRFNLRVYAIILQGENILLADECINGYCFTKFPGGGVEPGEGILDALKRELQEEGNIEASVFRHFYTTDFFQRSAFHPRDQIVSVYYHTEAELNWQRYESDQSVPVKTHSVKLYFKPLEDLREEDLTFPIDKLVLVKLKKSALF